MTVIKALSLFHGNPQTSDLKPDFWNCFKKKQHCPCTSNTQLKGSEKKKGKKIQSNRHMNYHVPTMTEQLKIAQKQNKREKLCYPPPVSSPKPWHKWTTPNLTIAPSYVVTTQWSWYPWHKWGNLMDMELQAMMVYWSYTWDLVEALQSASPASCKTPATFNNSICPNNHPARKKNSVLREEPVEPKLW